MQYKELANYVSSHLKNFSAETGFKIKSGSAGGFSFYKKTGTTTFGFGCGIANYGDRHVLNSFNAGIYYHEVDQILTPILVRNNLFGKSILRAGIPSVNVQVMFEDYGVVYPEELTTLEGLVVDSEPTANVLVEGIKIFYRQIASPFFEKFSKLCDVLPLMETKNSREISDRFGIEGKFRKAVVYKLCGHADYEQYMSALEKEYDELYERVKGDEYFMQFYKTCKELKEALESV